MHLVTNFPKFGLDIRDEAGAAALMSGEMSITNSLFFNNGDEGDADDLAVLKMAIRMMTHL